MREEESYPVDLDELPRQWLEKFEANNLIVGDIKRSWKFFVPEIFSPQVRICHYSTVHLGLCIASSLYVATRDG